MTYPDAFVRAIAESLYDDTPRLIFADWLDDHGDQARAEFIRIQCELEPMRDQYEIDRAAELHRRENELLWKYEKKWLGKMPEWDDWRPDPAVKFRRGFVDTVSMPVRTFLDLGPKVLRSYPTIRRVVLFRVHGYGERLAACPALDGLAELELACWYSDADARAIAASPHLGRLQVLEVWLGRADGLMDSQLCRIMAGSKAWPRLRELTLLNPDGEKERSRKRLVATANKVAGRKIAVHRRGYPELFPFAADCRELFAGSLQDGRTALATVRQSNGTEPRTLCIITFDKKGNQTDDVLTVALPGDLLAIPEAKWFLYKHRDRLKQHLIDAIGFRPGFIRIRGCHFPGDEYENGWNSPARGHDEYWEQLGLPDNDDEDSWQEHPCGIGGQISWLVRKGEYVRGWGDWWSDKEGQVHST
jgi:uncharacterized protein (TIGR02996 family)